MSSILREHAGALQELTKVREITVFGYGNSWKIAYMAQKFEIQPFFSRLLFKELNILCSGAVRLKNKLI